MRDLFLIEADIVPFVDISHLHSARIRSERHLSPTLVKGCVEFKLARPLSGFIGRSDTVSSIVDLVPWDFYSKKV